MCHTQRNFRLIIYVIFGFNTTGGRSTMSDGWITRQYQQTSKWWEIMKLVWKSFFLRGINNWTQLECESHFGYFLWWLIFRCGVAKISQFIVFVFGALRFPSGNRTVLILAFRLFFVFFSFQYFILYLPKDCGCLINVFTFRHGIIIWSMLVQHFLRISASYKQDREMPQIP